MPGARIADPEGMDVPAATVYHRTPTGAGAHGRGTDVTVSDHRLPLSAAGAETAVGADAYPVSLLGIPRHGQHAAVMVLTRGPPPDLRRHELPDPYPAVRAADGKLACRAEPDGRNLLPVRPFREQHRRMRGTHIPHP